MVLVSPGQNMMDAIRQIGVSEVTYYRWRQEFGGLVGGLHINGRQGADPDQQVELAEAELELLHHR